MRHTSIISTAIIALFLLGGCVSAPLDYPRETTGAIQDTGNTVQAGYVERWLDGDTDRNGFYPLNEGFDAFGARLLLIDSAEVSVDLQYFLMKSDNALSAARRELLAAVVSNINDCYY